MLVNKKKKRRNFFKSMYKKDENGAYIIEIDLDIYEDIFNDWDHAPFRRKDIDPDLQNYLEECADEIPLKYPIVLYFFVPSKVENEDKELMVKKGIKNFFQSYIMLLEKNLEHSRKNAVIYLITGILFITMAITVEKIFRQSLASKVVLEGIYIGGWVLFWEVFDLLFIRYRSKWKEKKEYERFFDSAVKFVYGKKGELQM